MLYIFEFEGTGFVKMGYAKSCDGFWRLVHPEECCGKLGWENLRLIALWPGTLADEAFVQSHVERCAGEFWPKPDLFMLQLAMRVQVCAEHGCDTDNWQLPLPEKPATPPIGRGTEKRPCCGGRGVVCLGCERPLMLWVHLSTHMRERCPARREAGLEVVKVDCTVWTKRPIPRNLKRHQNGEKCKRAGDAPGASVIFM